MIEISLLGRIDFTVNGKDAEEALTSSRKGMQMLIMLLLNYGKTVSVTQLYESLWSEESSSNPESALKTLVSRTRSALAGVDESLRACIRTTHGAYMWNTELECTIDILRVEEVCTRLLAANEITDEVRADTDQLILDYQGDVYTGREDDIMCVSRATHYHELYIKTICHVVELHRAAQDYERVIQLARTALDIDAFSEQLHIALMDSLVKLNRASEALSQYRHMSAMHFSYLGMPPSENMRNFYKQITRADQSLGMDIEAIRRSLESGDERKGAFVCEYAIFKDVYQLQMRNLQRLGTTMYLAVIMLAPRGETQVEPFELDKSMRQLLNVMVGCLRKGDTITRYSPSQYALLLPSVNATTGRLVIKRIRTLYYSEYVNPELVFSYKLTPVGVNLPAKPNAVIASV